MADVLAVRDEYRLKEWTEVYRRCRESGLSNREFCRENGIAEKTFYYWLKKLREAAIDSQPQLVALDDGTNVDDNMIHIRFGADERRGDCRAAASAATAMIDLSRVRNYYVACGYTDLRRGIDGLASIVVTQYGMELREDSLFLFCGRRTDRIKALYWSGDGYVLIYKRLTGGSFQWPRSPEELKSLDAQSFRWLMEGLKIEQPKAIRKSKQKSLF